MTMMKCSICGKRLTDPISIEHGIGPDCRLSLKLNQAKNMTRHLFNERSDYSYELRGHVVCIVDHDNGKSVTNDIREVLADLTRDGLDLSRHRVIYRDSLKIWDEVVLKGAMFHDFKSLNERELDAALQKVAAA
jgi:hypothetical protein